MTKLAATDHTRLYTWRFFQVFVAVMFFMTGVALQFHFGEFVAHLGYGVDVLGLILSIGMIGTLLVRLQLGRWIDRFGCRPTWVIGSAITAFSVGSMQFVESLWLIIALRIATTIAMAAVMTTVAVFAAQIAPQARRAESIGIMGLAGFLGMMVGPMLGDWIFSEDVESPAPFRMFFSGAALSSLIAGGIMFGMKTPSADAPLSRGNAASPALPPSTVSSLAIVRSHWPGAILLVGVVFSLVFCLISVFLERLAEERGFRSIKVFFLVYGSTAIILRLAFRRIPEQLGRTRTVVGGLVLQAVGIVSLIGISAQWQLVLPGIVMGAGHCFVFPSMIDLAAGRLPHEYRGVGTSLILGAGDLGNVVGFFVMGETISRFGFDICLAALAFTILVGAAFFAYCRRHAVFRKAVAG